MSLSDQGPVRHLHLGTAWVQGSMFHNDPVRLVHEYVQRMMAWLLFVDAESVPERRALQLGLGAASLTKFCALKLGMDTTAIELNPQVLSACRHWFRLPADGPRLRVLLADAAQAITRPEWAGTVDALQVDLYDSEAAAPALDSLPFYKHCRALLSAEGCMTVNVFGRSSSFVRSSEKIAAAFGAEALWAFKPTREGNTVLLAQRQPRRLPRELLVARAQAIEARWGLPAPRWVRGLAPFKAPRALGAAAPSPGSAGSAA